MSIPTLCATTGALLALIAAVAVAALVWDHVATRRPRVGAHFAPTRAERFVAR
jgi:hypothetical protein